MFDMKTIRLSWDWQYDYKNQLDKQTATLFDKVFDPEREMCVSILLNTRHTAFAHSFVSIGTLNESIVHPRDVFRGAIALSAHSIVLAHCLWGAPHKQCYVQFRIMWSAMPLRNRQCCFSNWLRGGALHIINAAKATSGRLPIRLVFSNSCCRFSRKW